MPGRQVILISPSMSGAYSLPYLSMFSEKLAGFVTVAPVGATRISKATYGLIETPTLITYGSRDRHLGQQGAEYLRKLKNSKIVVIKNAGHACYMNQPKVWHRHVRKFIKSIISTRH